MSALPMASGLQLLEGSPFEDHSSSTNNHIRPTIAHGAGCRIYDIPPSFCCPCS